LVAVRAGASLAVASGPPTWAEIATACIALIALVGAFIQLSSTRRATRRTTAFAYFERYSDPAALPYVTEMLRLLAKSTPSQDDSARWQAWKKKRAKAKLRSLVFVNFWEELGGLYNRRLVDRSVIRQYFGPLIVALWEEGDWFVTRCRSEDDHAFRDWEKMADHIKPWLLARDKPSWWTLPPGSIAFTE
jgi:hypothetical protein